MLKRKKKGQIFLINKVIAEKEIDYAKINRNDIVLEIGPGKGIITELLAKKAKKVIAIEIDKHLHNKLKNILPDNVILIQGDALKIDFKTLPKFNKIVSNLPYQISSPITFKFLNHGFSIAVLIYQKEFAERMIAKPKEKNYSRLSVGIYYKSECEIVENIPRYYFDPIPKIDSCIVRLKPRKKPPFDIIDEDLFFEITNNLFSQRRKKIKNIINQIYKIKSESMPHKDKRVEELSPEQIGEISNVLCSKI